MRRLMQRVLRRVLRAAVGAQTKILRGTLADLTQEITETKCGVSAIQGQLAAVISDLSRELAETKGGVSAIQGQLGDTWSHTLAMRHEIAGLIRELAETKGGVSTMQDRVDETAAAVARLAAERGGQNGQIRQLPHLLDATAARCLAVNAATAATTNDNRELASYYARLAGLVAQHWVKQSRLPLDPHPGDDMTLDYSVHSGVYVPGNEAEIDPREAFLPWRQLWSDPDCGVLLVLGQSNAGNHGETPYSSREEVYSLDFLRMRCFQASDPLAGASGNGGSVWSRLGDMLVENGVWRRVLFIPLAFGGSFIAQWTPGGPMHRRTALALRRLREELGQSLLPFSAVLWQQGEAEANHSQMSVLDYKMHFQDVVADLRANGVFAPVFIAQATICEGDPHPHNNHTAIREAQITLPDPSVGILPGPDTDSIGPEGRYDGCHFSDAGLRHCAELWLDVLARRRGLLQKIRPSR